MRNTPVREAYRIDSWSDTRITAVAPSSRYARPGQNYVVAILDECGRILSNSNREIRINNYHPATGGLREGDSFVQRSDALGGSVRRFNIGPAVTGPRKYYINDINLAGTRVSPVGEELRVAITLHCVIST